MSDLPVSPSESQEEYQQLPDTPESKVGHILQELEFFAMQQKGGRGLDIGSLNNEQFDRMLGLLAKNEDNALEFHKKRLDVIEKVSIRRIDASTTNQKTLRIFLIIAAVIGLAITGSILFFKEQFFIPWLTFLTGLFGGFGLNKIGRFILKEPPKGSPVPDEE
jgi:hypothetical protein